MNRWPHVLKASAIAIFMTATALLCGSAFAQEKSIVVASTTSTQDSGLFGYLLPIVKQRTGIEVKVLAQGTGQALDTARRCDADVVFVHAKSAEEKFLAEGYGVKRYPVMYNDFILVGPKDDPAGVKGKDILTALQTIKRRQRPSSRVATAPARTSPRSIFGKRRVSTSSTIKGLGTRKSAKAWALPSIWRQRQTPTCCPIVALGSRFRIAVTLSSLSKATSASLINTASCW